MLPEWNESPLLGKRELWSCLPHPPIDRIGKVMGDLIELPLVVQLPEEQGDPRQAGRDLVQAPDWEQQGHPGLPEEPLRGREEEGHHRLGRVGGLEGFVLAEKVALGVKSPRVE